MFFQNGDGPPPIFIAIPLILVGLLLFKIGLVAAKAQEKTNFKWVAGSYFLQFGVIFFVSSPLFLLGMVGEFDGNPGIIAPIVLLSIFIALNIVNLIHEIGLKRSFAVVFLSAGPIIGAMVIIGMNLGGP